MSVYGYARVSTKKQERDGTSLESQRTELEANGCDVIIVESQSGKDLDHRPELTALLDRLQPGDILVVTKLDRLARSALDGLKIVDSLLCQGISLYIINMGKIDNSPIGRLMYTMFLAFAQFERDMIVTRTQEGRAARRAASPNALDGRPFKYSPEQQAHALELLTTHSYTEVSAMTGISVTTLQRIRRRAASK